MNVKYDLVVDFARPSKSNTIIVSEGDTNSRLCRFTLLNNKQPMGMSDVTVASIRGVKSDGSVVYGDATIIQDDYGQNINEIEYTLPAAITDTAGDVTMTITLLSSTNEQLTSFEFYILVRNALYNEDDLVSESDLSGFRDLLNRALIAVKKAEELTLSETLPNPYPLNMTIAGEEYSYTGAELVEIVLNNMAYLAEEGTIVDAIDETAATRAIAAAEAAEAAALIAKTHGENAVESSELAVAKANEATSAKNLAENYSGLCSAYSTTAQNASQEATEASTTAKRYYDLIKATETRLESMAANVSRNNTSINNLNNQVTKKLDKPEIEGAPGQVLGIGDEGEYKWVNAGGGSGGSLTVTKVTEEQYAQLSDEEKSTGTYLVIID